jgi:hypothetical protein
MMNGTLYRIDSTNSTAGTTTSTTDGTACCHYLTVWIDGRSHRCVYDPMTRTVELPFVTAGSTIEVNYEYPEDVAETRHSEIAEEFTRAMASFSKPPWECENWSPRMQVGSHLEGVRRPPPQNRPMRRQVKPPSWMRRKRA